MDVYKALRELYQEKKRLDAMIASLETTLKRNKPAAPRRGRRNMGPEERRAVSERMAAYWASRRAAQSNNSKPVESGQSEATSAG
ncbi:MAG TPA: hypothetical protein VFA04_19725 [Bryobacteraceae bacterium]|nr:hypothetical protein [Bryobacteraceae bacterium]